MTTLEISVEYIELRRPVAILRMNGLLDASSYLELIANARYVFEGGTRHLVLDMQDITRVSSAGLMALHSIAVMLRGEAPPDPEAGWVAIHAAADDLDRGIQPYVKLLNPQPQVRQVLDLVGFTTYFEIYSSLEAALSAWGLVAADSRSTESGFALPREPICQMC